MSEGGEKRGRLRRRQVERTQSLETRLEHLSGLPTTLSHLPFSWGVLSNRWGGLCVEFIQQLMKCPEADRWCNKRSATEPCLGAVLHKVQTHTVPREEASTDTGSRKCHLRYLRYLRSVPCSTQLATRKHTQKCQHTVVRTKNQG